MEQTEQTVYKCKVCGEPLDLQKAKNGVVKCEVCDSYNTVPIVQEPTEPLGFFKEIFTKLLEKLKAYIKNILKL